MPARVTSDAFIGRRAELADLEVALSTARGCCATLAFVAGESGVGKTRLIDEFVTSARAGGARVLWGDCVELGDRELPYGPIVGALRDLVRKGDPALDDLGPARAELARLLPELGAVADLRVEPLAGTSQGRLFEILLALLDRLSRDAPLVLVLEDVHWADTSTRDFLSFLARNLCGERVLVVATYRLDELHRRHPLRPLLAEVERLERTRRIVVPRFTRDELAAQLASILEREPDHELVERLWARSEGNALYAEELLAAGREGGGALPDSLREALMLRVEALPEAAQEALRWIAVAQRIDHELLRGVSGIDQRELRDGLRHAITHHVLVGHEDGTYGFRHALLREAVHDDLLPGEQGELHLALARALEATTDCVECQGLDVAAAIAHHYDAAGDQPAALRAAVRAADLAEGVHAAREAAALYERALELWDRVEDAAALCGCSHVDLLYRAARVQDLDPQRAITLVKSALTEVDRETDPYTAAKLLERLGKARWGLGKGDAAVEAWDEALALLPWDPPTTEGAKLLASKATGFMLWGRWEDALELCEQALAAAEAAGSDWARRHTMLTKGIVLLGVGRPGEGEALLRAAMEESRAADETAQLVRGYINLSDVLHLVGRTEEAHALLVDGRRELKAKGYHGTWMELQLAEMAYHLGRWDESDALMPPELAPRHRGMTLVFYETRRAELELAQGRHDSARARLAHAEELASRSFEPQWHAPIAALTAALERRARDIDAARAAVATGLARLDTAGRLAAAPHRARILAAGAGVEADAAQQARDLGRPEDVAAAAEAAAAFARATREAADTPAGRCVPETGVHALVAEAQAAAAAGANDPDRWAAAAEGWRALQRPYRIARLRRKEAEAALETGDRERAREAAAEAHALAVQLGAEWLRDEVAALARRARLPLGAGAAQDAPAAPAPDGDDPAGAFGLTPREREVLALVAQGRTNREIGEALYMAEKTASVHVSRILQKLDVRSRTQAAAVAHRLGIEGVGEEVAAAG